MDLSKLDTEQRNSKTCMIDTLETQEMLTLINNEDKSVPYVVEECIPSITKLVDACAERMKDGGRLFYVGAGTSGRLGVLDASECPPTYGVSFDLIRGLIAGGYGALLKAKEGAEDDPELAKDELIELQFNAKDTLVGLAASGRTPYVIGALQYANEIGALTGSICCVQDGEISNYAKYPIEAVTKAEVITGSTRMKAGTAQKLILNMISTTLMIKYGKVYQNLMVDVQTTNEKLVERGKRIIMEATGCDLTQASHTLEESGHNVKLSICMVLSGSSKEACLTILEQEHGNVSATIRKLLHS